MYYTYRTPVRGEAVRRDMMWPGAIGFGATREDAQDAYFANGGHDHVELLTTVKSKTPFAVIDTVKQQATQSYYPW